MDRDDRQAYRVQITFGCRRTRNIETHVVLARDAEDTRAQAERLRRRLLYAGARWAKVMQRVGGEVARGLRVGPCPVARS